MGAGTSERDIDRFFAVSPELLCILSAGGGFLKWNFAWESTLGHGLEEMTRVTFVDLVHPEDAGVTRAQLERLRGVADRVDDRRSDAVVKVRLENRFRTRSGLYVRLSWSLLSMPGEGLIYGTARNVDKQRRVEKALMQRIEAKMLVASISSHFIDARPEDVDRGLDEALAQLGRTLEADRCCLLLLSEDGTAVVGARSWAGDGVSEVPCETAAPEEALSWLLTRLRTEELVDVGRVADIPEEAVRGLYERADVQSFMRVPAEYAGKLVGALGVDAVRRSRPWSSATRALLESVGEMAAMTLERKRAEDSLRDVLEQQGHMRAVIQEQEVAIQLLSTPIIQVWDGVLALPIVGAIDARRAADIMEKLLERIVETQSRFAILELTGVEDIDTTTAHHLLKMLRSIALLGAQGIVAGVRPNVAQTLASLGGFTADTGGIHRDLMHALRWCMSRR